MAIFKDHKIGVSELLSVIPDDALLRLSKETKVDYCVKVLHGCTLFYLLTYGLLDSDRFSQRSLEDAFKAPFYQLLFNLEGKRHVTHSSISERLKNVDISFFKQAYELIYERYSKLYNPEERKKLHLLRVDSTMITETCNKLSQGMNCQNSRSNKKQVKYTMVFDGLLPCHSEVYLDNKHLSEDNALAEVIENYIKKDKWHANIYVFDRGIQSGHTLSEYSGNSISFVGRLKEKRKHKELESLLTAETITRWGQYTLLQDSKVQLYSVPKVREGETKPRHAKLIDTPFRIIRIKNEKTGNICLLITDDFTATAEEIQERYMRRWDIEVFFRFIKQELNGKHLLSMNENGINVVLYMTLIVAMLLLIYKRENGIGYKTAKRRFKMELRDLIVALIVAYCGGDVEICRKLLET